MKKWWPLILVIGLLVFLFVAPVLAPHDPIDTNLNHVLQGPSDDFPLGTDQVGRCLLSRILYGARISVGSTIGLLSAMALTGLIVGVTASYFGGVVDQGIMRISDAVLAFPDMVFAIAVAGLIGPGLRNTLIALSIIWWTRYARLIRVLTARLLNRPFVEAARMAGASPLKIIRRYILPNLFPTLIVQYVTDIGSIMLAIASLSFVGLGVQAPLPEWGSMLNEGRPYLQTAPWLLIYPGMAIFFVVSICNITGDLLRDKMDPHDSSKSEMTNMYPQVGKRHLFRKLFVKDEKCKEGGKKQRYYQELKEGRKGGEAC